MSGGRSSPLTLKTVKEKIAELVAQEDVAHAFVLQDLLGLMAEQIQAGQDEEASLQLKQAGLSHELLGNTSAGHELLDNTWLRARQLEERERIKRRIADSHARVEDVVNTIRLCVAHYFVRRNDSNRPASLWWRLRWASCHLQGTVAAGMRERRACL